MEYVYVLQSNLDKKFYVGLTNDLRKRLEEHSSGKVFSTKNRLPVKLIYYGACFSRKDAAKRERYLKTAWGQKVHKEPFAYLSHGVILL